MPRGEHSKAAWMAPERTLSYVRRALGSRLRSPSSPLLPSLCLTSRVAWGRLFSLLEAFSSAKRACWYLPQRIVGGERSWYTQYLRPSPALGRLMSSSHGDVGAPGEMSRSGGCLGKGRQHRQQACLVMFMTPLSIHEAVHKNACRGTRRFCQRQAVQSQQT